MPPDDLSMRALRCLRWALAMTAPLGWGVLWVLHRGSGRPKQTPVEALRTSWAWPAAKALRAEWGRTAWPWVLVAMQLLIRWEARIPSPRALPPPHPPSPQGAALPAAPSQYQCIFDEYGYYVNGSLFGQARSLRRYADQGLWPAGMLREAWEHQTVGDRLPQAPWPDEAPPRRVPMPGVVRAL